MTNCSAVLPLGFWEGARLFPAALLVVWKTNASSCISPPSPKKAGENPGLEYRRDAAVGRQMALHHLQLINGGKKQCCLWATEQQHHLLLAFVKVCTQGLALPGAQPS